jgi:cell shape-determining protein MreD
MAYLAYIPLSLFLIVMQTVVLPVLFFVENSYDLMLIMVLFLGFYRSGAESIPVVFLLGFLSDCFSGGPFGLYTTTYLWLYVGVKSVVQFLHVDSWFVLLSGILSGVVLEHATVWLSLTMRQSQWHLSANSFKTAVYQIIWALLTGPLIFHMIKNFFFIWDLWFRKRFGSSMGPEDL